MIRRVRRLAREGIANLRLSRTARDVRRENLTYLPPRKLLRIEKAIRDTAKISGAILEFGVALGGSGIILAKSGREYHGFDVFGMIPPPNPENDAADAIGRFAVISGGQSLGLGGDAYYGYRTDLLSDVERSFARHQAPAFFHKGLFVETWPVARINRASLVHIDCDWHDPVAYCLEAVRDILSPGGIIIIDDYHDYEGAKIAVDAFLARNHQFSFRQGPNPLLVKELDLSPQGSSSS
ncbi:asparagine synthase [Croceicoccus ponticola]|uniref:Asparagine synthase n=1 Tax=Croceicoccus ponticola TaxID=2217664 RepID=A0A437GVZ3_9SPHN|nr:TylF/MycF/NovP-related O-methyltransferase [Croceicoccus ponticola]RVQ65798.1 asparagine synthase [Croceicoccus ponticola]